MVRMTTILALRKRRMQLPPPCLFHPRRRAQEPCVSATWCSPWKPRAGIPNMCLSITIVPLVLQLFLPNDPHPPVSRFLIRFWYVVVVVVFCDICAALSFLNPFVVAMVLEGRITVECPFYVRKNHSTIRPYWFCN
jgi:hypothetical protein